MRARDLVDAVRPDHQFGMTAQNHASGLFDEQVTQKFTLTCSCGWKTSLAVQVNMLLSKPTGPDDDRIVLWSRAEQLQHLLDQEIDATSVLALLQEQGTTELEILTYIDESAAQDKTRSHG